MDKDKLTTILSFIVAIMVGGGIVTQEQGSVLTQAGGIILALIIATWGYFTNKE